MHCSLSAEAVLACTWAEAELVRHAHCPRAVPVIFRASPAAGLWVGSSAISASDASRAMWWVVIQQYVHNIDMTVAPFCYLVQLN